MGNGIIGCTGTEDDEQHELMLPERHKVVKAEGPRTSARLGIQASFRDAVSFFAGLPGVETPGYFRARLWRFSSSRFAVSTSSKQRRPEGRLFLRHPPQNSHAGIFDATGSCGLRPGKRAVLEVILQDPRGQRGAQGASVVFHRAYNLSAAYYLCCRKSGDLRRKHQINFQLSAGL